MYHYTECGLKKVWLENGYKISRTSYGEGVSIADVESLHREIGRAIALRPQLTGAELRFLRKEMALSQRALAELLGASEQVVSLWERKGRIPRGISRLFKLIYLEHLDGNVSVQQIVEDLARQDGEPDEELRFKARAGHWRAAA